MAGVYKFIGPRSYSGEDTVELHVPGNVLLCRMLIAELIRRGARAAEPGEFTARAFFNGRLDLAEAEGVGVLVAASNESERKAARQLLAGELARRLRPVMEDITETLALLEVGIDFSDQDVTFLSDADLHARLMQARIGLQAILTDSSRIERLSHQPRFVLMGLPNAGKSTLINRLCGQTRAVVSDIAGTTRDVLSAEVDLARGRITLVDVAGLSSHPGDDGIATAMQSQTQRALHEADRVILVRPVGEIQSIDIGREADLVVVSKADQNTSSAGEGSALGNGELMVSARTGQGIEALRRRLDELAFGESDASASLVLNARHVTAIEQAVEAIGRAETDQAQGAEVVALELREALDALGSILGLLTPDKLLEEIFSRFCIGK